jgi:CBS-domain-containing membrane protein
MMREARVRRLPVVDDNDVLVGLVSLADLAQMAEREGTAASPEITPHEVGTTFAEISCPLHRQLTV